MPKAVKSDTKYDEYTDTAYTFTTHDKLWLLSGAETYQDSGRNNEVIRSNEGCTDSQAYYEVVKARRITTSAYSACKGNSETDEDSRWLRSIYRDNSNRAFSVDYEGDYTYYNVKKDNVAGLSPGFCID